MGLRAWIEKRAYRAGHFTDRIIEALVARAADKTAGDPFALAAVEFGASMIERAFASAKVGPEGTPAATAVTPSILGMVGRCLALKGEFLAEIEVMGGVIELVPSDSWDVTGPANRKEWIYRLEQASPSGNRSRRIEAGGVIHPRINCDPSEPWRGRSAIEKAGLTAKLAAGAESALHRETLLPSARIAAVPSPDDKERGAFAQRIREGGVVPVAGGALHPQGMEPKFDVTTVRPDPSAAMVTLRSDLAREALACMGVPVELYGAADGTSAREGWRRFLFGCIAPMAAVVLAEFREKLDEGALMFDFSELRASDLAGRARAFQSLVGGGLDIERAVNLAGLMESEGD